MPTDRTLILLNAFVFGVVGLLFLIIPEQMAKLITGGVPTTASGLIDMRATYGGALLGVGGILYILNIKQATRDVGLYTLITILGGMAVGRLIGMFVNGPANIVMYLFLIYEVVFVSLAWLSLRRTI